MAQMLLHSLSSTYVCTLADLSSHILIKQVSQMKKANVIEQDSFTFYYGVYCGALEKG